MSEKEILRQELEDGVPALQSAKENATPKQDTSKCKSLGPNNNSSDIWSVFTFLEHTYGASVTKNLLPARLSTYYLLNWLFLQQVKGAKSYSP